MLDNQLIALTIQILIAGEAAAGIPGTPIAAAFQPTLQGVNTEPTGYIYKIGDHRYGSPLRSDKWDTDSNTMVHTESQQYETTFQLSALATQNPNSPDQYTASDIVNLMAAILQSSVAIQTFQQNNVGILRITDARNPYFMDDREQYEASPSFDFILTHKQTIITATPISQTTELQVVQV